MTKQDIGAKLVTVCNNTISKAEDHAEFVQLVAKLTHMEGKLIGKPIGEQEKLLAKYLKTKYGITDDEFKQFAVLCIEDHKYPVLDDVVAATTE